MEEQSVLSHSPASFSVSWWLFWGILGEYKVPDSFFIPLELLLLLTASTLKQFCQYIEAVLLISPVLSCGQGNFPEENLIKLMYFSFMTTRF